jgi:polar amino acid transport system substrate-binding protein
MAPGRWIPATLLAMCLAAGPTTHAQVISAVGTDHFLNRAQPSKGGEPPGAVGAAVDLVHEVLKRAGFEHTITTYPWARAYFMAQTEANVLILSMARTPEREQGFKWVGEIAPVQYRLFKLKSRQDIRIKSLDDVKKFQIGVVSQDIAHLYLLERKIPDSAMQVTPSYSQAFKKLVVGRVDLVPRSQFGLKQFCDEAPADCDKIDSAYTMDEMNSSLYMAFSKQTSDEIVNKTRKAYEQIRAEGTWAKIIEPVLK